MDEDFFKDYPPVNGADQSATDTTAPESNQPILLGDPLDESTQQEQVYQNDSFNGAAPPSDEAQMECEAVTQWRMEFAKRLEEKVDEERRVKAQRAQDASDTLDQMHNKWKHLQAQQAEENEKRQREFIMQRDGVISRMSKAGEKPNWDIIPQLVDMTGKYKEGSRDTSRMRQVLLRMKTN